MHFVKENTFDQFSTVKAKIWRVTSQATKTKKTFTLFYVRVITRMCTCTRMCRIYTNISEHFGVNIYAINLYPARFGYIFTINSIYVYLYDLISPFGFQRTSSLLYRTKIR